MAVTGLWNIGGYNLPDFNLTENLGLTQWNNPLALANKNNVTSGLVNTSGQAVNTPTFSQQTPVNLNQQGISTYTPPTTVNSVQNTPTQPPAPTGTNNPVDPYQQNMLNSINSGWDSYTNQLNDMLNTGLPQQRTAQEQIAQSTYDQGLNTLGSQRTSSENALNQWQSKSLKDLSGNLTNMFNAGNTYLGARGAGDSSAANQYSYAIGKIGSKERGNIQTTAQGRMNQIGDIYNSETNRLKGDYDTKLAQIADWFAGAQNQIRQSLGQAGLNREKDIQTLSQTIYNQALSAMQMAQQEMAGQRSRLESWATYNAQNAKQLAQNMQAIQQLPQWQGINSATPQVTSQGQYYVPTGYGANTTQKRDLFGNIIG